MKPSEVKQWLRALGGSAPTWERFNSPKLAP